MESLTNVPSHFAPRETMDRLEAEIRKRGIEVFARIDHAAGAAKAGLELRPTEVIIFGNARVGTPLMQANQTIAIDLPLKILVWQDVSGETWISYREPAALAQTYGLRGETTRILDLMKTLLSDISRVAATSES